MLRSEEGIREQGSMLGLEPGLGPGLALIHEKFVSRLENCLALALALALALSRYLVTNSRSEAWHQSR